MAGCVAQSALFQGDVRVPMFRITTDEGRNDVLTRAIHAPILNGVGDVNELTTCPTTGRCVLQTAVHTWEDECNTCGGSGYVNTHISGKKKGKTVTSTCLKCSGLGALPNFLTARKSAYVRPARPPSSGDDGFRSSTDK
eukprot:9489570-Pyramimonas_sp.AAC.1